MCGFLEEQWVKRTKQNFRIDSGAKKPLVFLHSPSLSETMKETKGVRFRGAFV